MNKHTNKTNVSLAVACLAQFMCRRKILPRARGGKEEERSSHGNHSF